MNEVLKMQPFNLLSNVKSRAMVRGFESLDGIRKIDRSKKHCWVILSYGLFIMPVVQSSLNFKILKSH